MTDLFSTIGFIGTTLLAISGLPQAIKSIQDGHSDGIAQGTVLCWFFGEMAMSAYAIKSYTNDWILLANFILNFILVSIIFKYKYFKRKQ